MRDNVIATMNERPKPKEYAPLAIGVIAKIMDFVETLIGGVTKTPERDGLIWLNCFSLIRIGPIGDTNHLSQ